MRYTITEYRNNYLSGTWYLVRLYDERGRGELLFKDREIAESYARAKITGDHDLAIAMAKRRFEKTRPA